MQEKSRLLILDAAPMTKEVHCIAIIGRYVTSPHTLAYVTGEVCWGHLYNELSRRIFCSAFKSNQMQVEEERSNPLTSPSLKVADALEFTRQGLPCSRQWGREGGCSVRLPLLLRSAPRACICMCNFGISIYLGNCYADLWLRELGLFPGPLFVKEGALCLVNSRLHRPLATHQLARYQQLLQTAFRLTPTL